MKCQFDAFADYVSEAKTAMHVSSSSANTIPKRKRFRACCDLAGKLQAVSDMPYRPTVEGVQSTAAIMVSLNPCGAFVLTAGSASGLFSRCCG